jgi:plastocyanin
MFGTLIHRRTLPSVAIASVLMLSTIGTPTVSAQQEPRNVTVILTEYQFNPKTITLTVGEPVLLNVQNQGGLDHNLSSNDLPLASVHYLKADNSSNDLHRYEATNVLNADAGSGHTSMVTFTPVKTGTFGFFSEDEESLGLVGNFVVVAPGGQAAAPSAAPAPAAAASASSTVASDGQSLAGQSAATQAMFAAVWGDRAAQEWAQEHNASLPR